MNGNFHFDEERYRHFLDEVSLFVSDQEPIDTEEIKTIFSCIDNTTLNGYDTVSSVREFAVQTLTMQGMGVPHVASICIYPYFVSLLKQCLMDSPIAIASVAGGFPSGQLPLKLKLNEVRTVVEMEVDEVDYVINRGSFLEGGAAALYDEVAAVREECQSSLLKVILETAEIPSPKLIYDASITTLLAGADFVKTSTGKISVGATPEAATAMLMAIADYGHFSKKTVGFKAAGGLRTLQQALLYYRLSKKILGRKSLDKHRFRIGASSLSNQLLKILTIQ